MNKQNNKTIKTITENKKNNKWTRKARTISELDKAREINLKIKKKQLTIFTSNYRHLKC